MEEKKMQFVSLAKEVEAIEEKLSKKREELALLMTEVKVGTYIQDPILGTVYRVSKPKGRYVTFSDIDYVRTALEGERAGSLSKKEAEANGFKLE